MTDFLLWTVAAIFLAADFMLSDELDDRLLVVAIPSLIERNDPSTSPLPPPPPPGKINSAKFQALNRKN